MYILFIIYTINATYIFLIFIILSYFLPNFARTKNITSDNPVIDYNNFSPYLKAMHPALIHHAP